MVLCAYSCTASCSFMYDNYTDPLESFTVNSATFEHIVSRAELWRNGSIVSVSCEFYSKGSCVLVYQSKSLLNVIEYHIFPVSLTVDEEVTLFLFVMNGELQSEPLLTLREKETHVHVMYKTTVLQRRGRYTDTKTDTHVALKHECKQCFLFHVYIHTSS